jgi:hypothetical protein
LQGDSEQYFKPETAMMGETAGGFKSHYSIDSEKFVRLSEAAYGV